MLMRLGIDKNMDRTLQRVCDTERLGVLSTCCHCAEMHHRRASFDGSDLYLVQECIDRILLGQCLLQIL